MERWAEDKLAAELDARGWRLVHYEDGDKVKEGLSPFRAARPRDGTEAAARTPEKLLYRVDAYERERKPGSHRAGLHGPCESWRRRRPRRGPQAAYRAAPRGPPRPARRASNLDLPPP